MNIETEYSFNCTLHRSLCSLYPVKAEQAQCSCRLPAAWLCVGYLPLHAAIGPTN